MKLILMSGFSIIICIVILYPERLKMRKEQWIFISAVRVNGRDEREGRFH